jgi:hypothetical protein
LKLWVIMFIEVKRMRKYGNIFPFESFQLFFSWFSTLKVVMLVFNVKCLDLHPKQIGM